MSEIVDYYTEGSSCFKNALSLLFHPQCTEDILEKSHLDNHWPMTWVVLIYVGFSISSVCWHFAILEFHTLCFKMKLNFKRFFPVLNILNITVDAHGAKVLV